MNSEQYTKVKQLCAWNTRVLNVKYLGPTNHKGSRIKIIDRRFNQSITIPYDYQYSSALEGAVRYLLDKGWDIAGFNSDCHQTEYIVIIANWDCEQQLRGPQ